MNLVKTICRSYSRYWIASAREIVDFTLVFPDVATFALIKNKELKN
jgi:hypothetical protein